MEILKFPSDSLSIYFSQVYQDVKNNSNLPIPFKRCLERVFEGKRIFVVRTVNDVRCSYYRGAYRKYVIDVCPTVSRPEELKHVILHELVHLCKGNEVDARIIVNRVYKTGFSETDLLICKNLKFEGRWFNKRVVI